jgi:mannose-6-phosphate isomerase-like protein (cupin superfamily)
MLGAGVDRHLEPASPSSASVVHPDQRQAIELASGVRWEQLVAASDDGIDFLHAVYEVGGASAPGEEMLRHNGREYGYVISGTLGIRIGFDEYELTAGDSVSFDSTTPHRLFNKGDVHVHAVWFQIGRHTHT